MELNKKNVRTIIGIIILTLLIAAGLMNYVELWGTLFWVVSLIFPFILGGCLAFILNIPMRLIEKYVFSEKRVKNKHIKKLARPISMLLSIILVLVLIIVIMFLIVPEIARTVGVLQQSFPAFIKTVQEWVNNLAGSHSEIANALKNFSIDWKNMESSIGAFMQKGVVSFVNSTVDVASSIVGGIVNFFLGVIFAIYVLLQKEKLGGQVRRLAYAYLPENVADKIFFITDLSSNTFGNFITGQCTESVILGMLFFVAMLIVRLPYALMISVLIGFLSLIPIFGAFIGCFIGAFLILMVSPMQALIFVIVFLVIQQIEGNLIYPHVVGGSVGLPSIWVLVAVTVGGGAFGITGMIVTIPIFSICYTLLRETVGNRLEKLHIPKEKFKGSSEHF